jgi:hypothetical protein
VVDLGNSPCAISEGRYRLNSLFRSFTVLLLELDSDSHSRIPSFPPSYPGAPIRNLPLHEMSNPSRKARCIGLQFPMSDLVSQPQPLGSDKNPPNPQIQ